MSVTSKWAFAFALALLVVCSAPSSADEEDTGGPILVGLAERRPYVRTEDGKFFLEVAAFVQLDSRHVHYDETTSRNVLIRRARVKGEGDFLRRFEYELDYNLAEKEVRDLYLNARIRNFFQIRVGKAKLPFSQEEQRSSKYIDFVERSAVNNLIPDRSPGVMLHGDVEAARFEYAAGYFGVAGGGEGSREVVARVRFRPYETGPAAGLAFGGALGRGRARGGSSVQGRAGDRSFVFFEPVPINGDVRHDNLEAAWFYDSLAVFAELIRVGMDRDRVGADGTDLVPLEARGYTLSATYLLTGETKPWRSLTPTRPAFRDGGFGAVELAARYEDVRFTEGPLWQRDFRALTLGVNWYLQRYLRFQANVVWNRYGQPILENGLEDSTVGMLTRLQVLF